MALPTGYEVLLYRGHFRMTVALSYKEAVLSAGYGGGYREVENIFPPLRSANLSYPTLHRDAMIEVEEDTFVDRLTYIYNFYKDSKDEGNKPFLMKSPLDGKWFLWVFADDELSIELFDLYMGGAGVKLEQVYVRGVVPDNEDGSFDEE